MIISPELEAYKNTQNGIFAKFEAAQANLTTTGVEVDGGTALQSAFLVSWRLPEGVASEVAGYSYRLGKDIAAVPYGYDEEIIYGNGNGNGTNLDNAHVTLSDHKLTPGEVINPEDEETQLTLSGLTLAVDRGLAVTGGADALRAARVTMGQALHNGKTAVFPGTPNDALFAVRNAVLTAANAPDIRRLLGVPADAEKALKGAWGAHSTLSRVRDARPGGHSDVAELAATLADSPTFGEVRPSSLDVGYFVSDPRKLNGFVLHSVVRYEA